MEVVKTATPVQVQHVPESFTRKNFVLPQVVGILLILKSTLSHHFVRNKVFRRERFLLHRFGLSFRLF